MDDHGISELYMGDMTKDQVQCTLKHFLLNDGLICSNMSLEEEWRYGETNDLCSCWRGSHSLNDIKTISTTNLIFQIHSDLKIHVILIID